MSEYELALSEIISRRDVLLNQVGYAEREVEDIRTTLDTSIKQLDEMRTKAKEYDRAIWVLSASSNAAT